jgi:hypothetical protein
MYATPVEAGARQSAAPPPQDGPSHQNMAFRHLMQALSAPTQVSRRQLPDGADTAQTVPVVRDLGDTIYNPRPDGVDIMVVDDFDKPVGATDTTHGEQVAFLADQTSTSSTAEVYDISYYGFPGLASFFNRVAASSSPPEVINLSVKMDPATMFKYEFPALDREFKVTFGADPTLWPPSAQSLYKAGVQNLIDECVYDFSVQYSGIPAELKTSLQNLVEAGVNVTIASGNSGRAHALFDSLGITPPSDFFDGTWLADLPEGVIVVGASSGDTPTDKPALFTSPMNGVDVAADGTKITVNAAGKLDDGTSFSAPQVAGLVADIRAANPNLTPAQVESILKESATPIPGQEALVGAGVINREKALELAIMGGPVDEVAIRYFDRWDAAESGPVRDGLVSFGDVQAVASSTSGYSADERAAAQYLVDNPDIFTNWETAFSDNSDGLLAMQDLSLWRNRLTLAGDPTFAAATQVQANFYQFDTSETTTSDSLFGWDDVDRIANSATVGADAKQAAEYLAANPDLFDQLDSALDGQWDGKVSFMDITAWQAAQASA